MHRLVPFLLLLLLPTMALAEEVCIAEDGTPMYVPGTEEAVGTLQARQCYAVMERGVARTRIWVRAAGSFQGEVDVSNRDFAQVLVDDIPMKLDASGEPYGEALSGALVLIDRDVGGGLFLVKMLEGRVRAQFVVAEDEFFPAASWPVPDPEDVPDAGWPEATLPLPPSSLTLTSIGGGYDVHAEIVAPLFDLTDILLDPAMGQLRMTFLEQREFESRVRIVGRHLWVDGWATSVDWRAEPPEGGWNPMAGVPSLTTVATGTRQLGSKDAELALEAKGDAFGTLPAGSWVTLDEEDGAWQRVLVTWPHGTVRGWMEKKRLEKEKKQGEQPKPSVSRVAAIGVGNVAVEWFEGEGHDLEPELTPDFVRGLATDGIERLRRTYAEALAKRPNLTGEVTARLVVTPEGTIFEQSTPVATLADDGVRAALDAKLEGLLFPEVKPRKRKLDNNVVVWIQYVFKPMGQ